jgi:crossover junction endodeoxyribonuclease RuvC
VQPATVTGPVTVIGIDPGSQRTGWGVVREVSGVLRLVDCGVVRTAAAGGEFCDRLAKIYRDLDGILTRLQPQEAAIEQVFTAKNAASALKLGQARGVAVAACAAHGLAIRDYEPTLVKKSLVGTGRAEKEQVAFMVRQLLNVREAETPWALDTSDALAVALCHLTMRRFAARVAQGKIGSGRG